MKTKLNLKEGYYEGEVNLLGQPNGLGKMDYKLNGYYGTYEGQWVKGKRCGKGVFHKFSKGGGASHSYNYEGEWLDDLQHGQGVEEKSDEIGIHLSTVTEVYTGGFKEGNRHGHGVIVRDGFDGHFASGKDRFEGEFEDGKTIGHGVWEYANGDRFEGEFEAYGMKQGHGVYTFRDGLRFEGEWKNGVFDTDSFQADSSLDTPILLVTEHHSGFDYNKTGTFLIPVRKKGIAYYEQAAAISKDSSFDMDKTGLYILDVTTDSVTLEIRGVFYKDGKPSQVTLRRGDNVKIEDSHRATATIYDDDYDYTICDSIILSCR